MAITTIIRSHGPECNIIAPNTGQNGLPAAFAWARSVTTIAADKAIFEQTIKPASAPTNSKVKSFTGLRYRS